MIFSVVHSSPQLEYRELRVILRLSREAVLTEPLEQLVGIA